MAVALDPTKPLPPPTPPQISVRPKWSFGPRLRGLGAMTGTQKGLLIGGVIAVLFFGGVIWLSQK